MDIPVIEESEFTKINFNKLEDFQERFKIDMILENVQKNFSFKKN